MSLRKSENLVICSDCSNFIFSCQCICPYCGDIADGVRNCSCSKKTLGGKNTETNITNLEFDSMKKLNKIQDLIKEYDDDWKRLEKWKVGRSNFP